MPRNVGQVWLALDLSSGTLKIHLGLFGFFPPKKCTKMTFFDALWWAVLKNENKTIQLYFRQVGSYLVECCMVH